MVADVADCCELSDILKLLGRNNVGSDFETCLFGFWRLDLRDFAGDTCLVGQVFLDVFGGGGAVYPLEYYCTRPLLLWSVGVAFDTQISHFAQYFMMVDKVRAPYLLPAVRAYFAGGLDLFFFEGVEEIGYFDSSCDYGRRPF